MRVGFQKQGTTGVAVVKQENSYYPFGLIMPNSQIAKPGTSNKKLYKGGSEWQNDFGDLSDLYATYYRSYDAALGRFTGIDPKAELTDALSPYHYAGNNPVLYNDPMGDAVDDGNNGYGHLDGNGHLIPRDHSYGGFTNRLLNMTAKAMDGASSGGGGRANSTPTGNTGVAIYKQNGVVFNFIRGTFPSLGFNVVPDQYDIEVTVDGPAGSYNSMRYVGHNRVCLQRIGGSGLYTYKFTDDLSSETGAIFDLEVMNCDGTGANPL